MTNLRFYNYGDDWVGMEAEPSNDREATLQAEPAEASSKNEKQAEQQHNNEKAVEPPKYEPPSYDDEADDPPVTLPPEKERPGPPPPPGSFPEEPPHHPPPHHHPHHHGPPGCGSGRGRGAHFHHGGPFGGRGGHGFGQHPFSAGPGRCGRGEPPPGAFPFRGWGGPRGRWRDPAFWGQFRGGPGEEGFNMDAIANFLKETFGVDLSGSRGRSRSRGDPDADYVPPVDVFDTPKAFVIHVSLAGAKKEDLGVTWNAEDSSVHVAGVIHRPGDEELLKTIGMDERDVGAFARNVRLGDRTHPAAIDSDAITARMEDGVLIVEVPKSQDFVKSKKVEVE